MTDASGQGAKAAEGTRAVGEVPELSPAHRDMLVRGSGIREDVVAARGYRTVSVKADLQRLGFGKSQLNVPALLLPIRGVTGEVVLYQARPDEPRISKGKSVKYETPAGSRMVIDVPEFARRKIADPSAPLFITEGVKKADALVSRDVCAVALIGVWNWRGTNLQGGKTALPDWESIALNDRGVYVVFDSDVMLKREVHGALARFKPFLESRGAHVALIYLPSGAGATKQGVDDYLVAGHSVDELLALACTELRPVSEVDEGVERFGQYFVKNGALYVAKGNADAPSAVRLTNFDARVEREVVHDDGAERSSTYVISGTLAGGGPLPRVEVPASAFSSLNWVGEYFGVKAVVYPSQREHARVAIQTRNAEPGLHVAYGHLGWREVNGEWLYLHAGGAIGCEGAVDGVEVDLREGGLANYVLPDPPSDAREAVAPVFSLLDLAPPRLAYPLLASAVLAPLGQAMPGDLSIFLTGRTGTLKTASTAVFQSFYGAGFNDRNLAANWEGTANALEKQAFLAKDALLVIDDFSPAGAQADVQRLHAKADRVLRGQGNRAGRARMRADGGLRPEYFPRGVILASGEDQPSGHSLRARILFLDVQEGDIDPEALSAAQLAGAQGAYARAMSAYVMWLAPQMPRLPRSLQDRRVELRGGAVSGAEHRRTPDQVATLMTGFETFLRFAVEVEAISEGDQLAHWDACWAALGEVAVGQLAYQQAEDPVTRFLDLLAALLGTGEVHVAALDGGKPEAASAWGWKRDDYGDGLRPSGTLIGWLAEDELWLEPEASFKAVQVASRAQGQPLSVRQETLWKRLAERGLLGSTDKGRNTTKRTMAGQRRRVAPLRLDALSYSPEAGQPGQHASSTVPHENLAAPGQRMGGARPVEPGRGTVPAAVALGTEGPPSLNPGNGLHAGGATPRPVRVVAEALIGDVGPDDASAAGGSLPDDRDELRL